MLRRFRLLALPLALCACQSVPYTNRSRVLLVSAGEEKAMGERAYAEILKKGKLSKDDSQIALLRKVGRRLADAAQKPDFEWEFNLLDDDKQINAFCLPGGKVAFYTGILSVTAGEDGIAVVMSHEIAHALARHGGERMSRGVLADTGGRILSIMLGGGASQASGTLYRQLYGMGAGLVVLSYSRSQESEADKIGLILMAKAGYDLDEAVSFWGRMATATKGKRGEGAMDKFLSTHPASAERQAQIERWIPEIRTQYGSSGKSPTP